MKLLYVDDDDDIREVVELALGLDPGIELRVAGAGADALAMLDREPWRPEAVLLDVMMPGMDGLEVLARLRTIAGLETVPVLFMTARARDADVASYREQGAAGVIMKPFDPLTLAQQVRVLTGA